MYYVYILTNKTDEVMYIGVTNDLRRRLYEHKNEQIEGFTKKYHVHKLVYFEEYSEINDAIAREKQLKRGCSPKRIGFWKRKIQIGTLGEKVLFNQNIPFGFMTHVESVVCLTRRLDVDMRR